MRNRNIKLVLEYDGSSFFGFQKQPRHPTIQQALETALSKLLNQKTKITAASGRTDTGVHAEYQVVNFKTRSKLPTARIQKGLNSFLPKQIAVKSTAEVGPKFHARYGARSKIYEYRIYNGPVRSPLRLNRGYHVPEPLQVGRMRQAAKVLKGRHDFRAFCSSSGIPGADQKNTVRVIQNLTIRKSGPEIRIQIKGNGFLYRMSRNIVGTLLEVGKGKITAGELSRVLKSGDRRRAGPAAPAHGLTLVKVLY